MRVAAPNFVNMDKTSYSAGPIRWNRFRSFESILVGKYCSISENVTICAGGQHRTDLVSTYPFNGDQFYSSNGCQIVLGNDVWIGMGVHIGGYVTIGDGAIVGAGSVVFSDVPPYAIVAGNPKRLLRYRFSRTIRKKLLEIKWWNWSDKVIKERKEWFLKPVQEFVDEFYPVS
jgi:carbonic anhydrase/acetyltransferase-like protein (isoleucine patch superfamily)